MIKNYHTVFRFLRGLLRGPLNIKSVRIEGVYLEFELLARAGTVSAARAKALYSQENVFARKLLLRDDGIAIITSHFQAVFQALPCYIHRHYHRNGK